MYCCNLGRKLLYFPTALESSTAPLRVSPPLRSNREAPTDWLAAWGAGVGAAEDFPIKAGIPRPDALFSLSELQTGAALSREQLFHSPCYSSENPPSLIRKEILVYGSDWHAYKDVPDRRGAPYNGECLQGKPGCLVVCFGSADRASFCRSETPAAPVNRGV